MVDDSWSNADFHRCLYALQKPRLGQQGSWNNLGTIVTEVFSEEQFFEHSCLFPIQLLQPDPAPSPQWEVCHACTMQGVPKPLSNSNFPLQFAHCRERFWPHASAVLPDPVEPFQLRDLSHELSQALAISSILTILIRVLCTKESRHRSLLNKLNRGRQTAPSRFSWQGDVSVL